MEFETETGDVIVFESDNDCESESLPKETLISEKKEPQKRRGIKDFLLDGLACILVGYDHLVAASPWWLRAIGRGVRKLWFGFSYVGWVPCIFFPPMWVPYLVIAAIPLLVTIVWYLLLGAYMLFFFFAMFMANSR